MKLKNAILTLCLVLFPFSMAAAKEKLPKPDYTSMEDIKLAGPMAVGKLAQLKVEKGSIETGRQLVCKDEKSGSFMRLSFSEEQDKIVKGIPGHFSGGATALFRIVRVTDDHYEVHGELVAVRGRRK